MMVLEGQDTQRKLCEAVELHKNDPTDKQSSNIAEQRVALRRHVRDISVLQMIYMPGLLQFLDNGVEEEDELQPESVKLWLPSDIPAERRPDVLLKGLEKVEAKLQQARCYDALNALRHTLCIKARMMHFKNTNVRGQRESGRSRAVINRVYRKARHFAARYRLARKAYLSLMGPGDWENTLRVLEDSNICSYRDPALVKFGPGRRGTEENEEKEPRKSAPASDIELIAPDRTEWAHRRVHGTGETRKEQSWIWVSGGMIDMADGAEEDNQILRSEWCRSRARVKRAEEEVLLVGEEMRRTLAFLCYKVNEWQVWETRWDSACKDLPGGSLLEGMSAYASAQAAFQKRLGDAFQIQWEKPLQEMGMASEEDMEELDAEDGRLDEPGMDGNEEEHMEDEEEEM
ncbi:hypothetical protein VNI00_016499 [Paramarasmius palmivorus]|uniref:Uncharacterized protein n=1 Tax=Paramarasmius palmivorus TaxID=297713 RepID=A0AAW0BDI8_9AGAR